MILFNVGDGRLMRVSAAGGQPAVVLTPSSGTSDTRLRWPHFLPDGGHFLYTETFGGNSGRTKPAIVRVGSLDDKNEGTRLFEAESSVIYASGHLLFAKDGALMTQAFDAETRRLTGDATPLVERVGNEGSRYTSVSASQNGLLVYAAPPDPPTNPRRGPICRWASEPP